MFAFNYETSKMRTKSIYLKCVVILVVILVLVQICDSKKGVTSKFKRKVGDVSDNRNNLLGRGRTNNSSSKANSRGFFGHGKY